MPIRYPSRSGICYALNVPLAGVNMSTEAAITIHRLSKSYQEAGQRHEIFNGLNLQIDRGELIVLLGRSGSGKSTFLNLVSGIDQPDSGDIIINGVHLTKLSEHDRTLFRRHHIGFVFQAYNLIPTLTVAENLLLPLELIKRTGRQSRDKVNSLLEQLDLASRVNVYPDRLSGGEQQRVAIARALIHDPDVVLADEPTGNLDLDTGQQVLALFDALVKKTGKTLIMATHSREVLGKADRIFSIHNKSLVIAREAVYATSQ
jgi:putative ABC transport system ATP-binding protein